jgi:hypothetical protein
MRVNIDHAGQNQQARSVDLTGYCRLRQPIFDRHDAPARHRNVGLAPAAGRNDRPTTDNQVDGHA